MPDEPQNPLLSAQDASDDFVSDYANNVAFEATVWDLKLIFGEYSQRANGVEWHTSITIPWEQAKIMSYFLQVNIEAHEIRTGRPILPPPMMIPPPIPEPPDKSDQEAMKMFEMFKRNRERLIESIGGSA